MAFSSTCCACDHVDKSEENFQPQQSQRPETKEVPPEKSRLQEFVKDFAKCAVRGVPCEVIDGTSGAKLEMAYFVDPPLQRLTLKQGRPGSADTDGPHRDIILSDIKDIFDIETAKSVDKTGSTVPQVVQDAVRADGMRERLVVITFEDGGQGAFILEGSAVDRDRFIMCVKILRLYAQTHGRVETSS